MILRAPTLLWLLINVVLLILLVWLWRLPVVPNWLAETQADPAAEATFTASKVELSQLPKAELERVWQMPIFSPDRQPDPVPKTLVARPLPALTLTGIVVSGDVRHLYLHESGQPGRRLSPGDTLEGGWTLSELDAHSATFTRQGEHRTLQLPVKRLPPPSTHSPLTLPSIKTP